MKFISTLTSLSIIFGCGILSLIFGLPERYIERNVKTEEMVGTWSITPDSESEVNDFLQRYPSWGASAPWEAFTLNGDGTCNLKLKTDWLGDSYSDLNEDSVISCSWDLATEKNLSDKWTPVLELDLEYSNNYGALYSLYIYEENGKLIIWDFIGDPDDFHPQDFVIVEQ